MTASSRALLPPPAYAAGGIDTDDEPSLRGVVVMALICAIALFGGVLGWSFFAKLDSASVSRGVVAVDSHRKTVQHLEGGILRTILVREGEQVSLGQPLVELDTTQAEAQLDQLLNQQITVRARMARLRAEQAGQRTLIFPEQLIADAAARRAEDVIQVQSTLFDARWQAYDSATAVIRARIEQYRKNISSAEAQLAASERQIALFEEELAAAEYLLKQGYERRPRVLELRRQVADLKGRKGDLENTIASSEQQIEGADVEIRNLGDERLATVIAELDETLTMQSDLTERIRSARDVLDRRIIVSPQDGVVVDIRNMTPGGVIGPGEPILDIVPVDDPLIVEARVDPKDIDVVRPGLPARVRLSAYKSTWTPEVDGVVEYVTADKMADAKTGEAYFLVRVRLSPESLAEHDDLVPSPGMPADVMIVTGNRRAIDYFLAPLMDRLRHSFRED